MPDLSEQLQNIATYLCNCMPYGPISVDPDAHKAFCAFRVASLAVDMSVKGGQDG